VKKVSEQQDKLIDSLKDVLDRLDEIIDTKKPFRFKDDIHEYSQAELQNIREFLEKMRNETINEYYEQLKENRRNEI
jgi:hypothetical protein